MKGLGEGVFLLFTWAHVELTIVRGEGVQVWGIGGGFGKGLSGNRGVMG